MHELLSKKLEMLGDTWLTVVLVIIALFLLFIAFVDHNVTRKAIIAVWVLMP